MAAEKGLQSQARAKRAGRIGWIEWARALGALGVLLLHVCTSTFLVPDVEVERMLPYTVLGIVFGRWAVPSFFMVTGYLLLDPARKVSWTQVRRYALRMVMVLASFGLVFSIMEETLVSLEALEGGGEVLALGLLVLGRAVRDVLTASSWDHLWYVYALVFVYLLVPAVRELRARVGERGFAVVTAALFVIVLVVPTVLRMVQVAGGEFVELPQQGFVALVCNVAIGATCLCMGGCLSKLRFGVPVVVVAGVGSLAAMLGVGITHLLGAGDDAGFIFLQGSCFSCAYAVFVLLVLRHVVGNDPVREGSIIDQLARDSFGIYVLHPVFVHAGLMLFNPMKFPAGLYEVVLYVVVLAASIVATRLVRRIPALGDLL